MEEKAITIQNITMAKKEQQKPYKILDLCHWGYLVQKRGSEDISVYNADFIKKNIEQISNAVGIYEEKPLVYIPKTYQYGDRSVKEAFFLGKDPARVEVVIKIRDDHPEKRHYSNSVINFSGKELTGTIKDIAITIDKASDIRSSYSCTICQFEDLPKRYKHGLNFQSGNLSIDGDDLIFSSAKKQNFCKYRSGCGYDEHYIVPNSDYVKYVSCSAKIGKIGDRFSLQYEVSDDPEYLLKKKLEGLGLTIHIETDPVYSANEDGHYKETIRVIDLQIRKTSDENYKIFAEYIPEEYKGRSKAAEYAEFCDIPLLCRRLEECSTQKTIDMILEYVSCMIDDAKEEGISINEPTIEWIKEKRESLLEEKDLKEFEEEREEL